MRTRARGAELVSGVLMGFREIFAPVPPSAQELRGLRQVAASTGVLSRTRASCAFAWLRAGGEIRPNGAGRGGASRARHFAGMDAPFRRASADRRAGYANARRL